MTEKESEDGSISTQGKRFLDNLLKNHVATNALLIGSALLLLACASLYTTSSPSSNRSLRSVNPSVGPVKPRLLYIITSSQEYNDGSRATTSGQDRLMEVVMPVILDGLESMLADSYEVDVYLILAYTLRPDRQQRVQDMLPAGVGLEVWSDACPLSYDWPKTEGKTVDDIDRALARQHRFVVKDKFPFYSLFVVFEDDMLVKSSHIRYHLSLSAELDRLRESAPVALPDNETQTFYSPLTKGQIARMRPAFIRVEVLLDESKYPAQKEPDKVPIDHNFTAENGSTFNADVDPEPCCHVRHIGLNGTLAPPTPKPDQLMVWETGIRGISVRKMPKPSRLKWVGLLTGPTGMHKLSSYWPGSNGVLPDADRADDFNPNFLANSAGWVATRSQIMEKHEVICDGGFLPPWDNPVYPFDALQMHNVEFWSGGIQM